MGGIGGIMRSTGTVDVLGKLPYAYARQVGKPKKENGKLQRENGKPVCSTFVLICFTRPAITVGTVILWALDRVRGRVLGWLGPGSFSGRCCCVLNFRIPS